jgi:hypothetical protein
MLHGDDPGEVAVHARGSQQPQPRCIECGREQPPDERGWKAYLTVDEDEPAEAVVYCPDCAQREFGEREKPSPSRPLDRPGQP